MLGRLGEVARTLQSRLGLTQVGFKQIGWSKVGLALSAAVILVSGLVLSYRLRDLDWGAVATAVRAVPLAHAAAAGFFVGCGRAENRFNRHRRPVRAVAGRDTCLEVRGLSRSAGCTGRKQKACLYMPTMAPAALASTVRVIRFKPQMSATECIMQMSLTPTNCLTWPLARVLNMIVGTPNGAAPE